MINENILRNLDFDEKGEICAINNEPFTFQEKDPELPRNI